MPIRYQGIEFDTVKELKEYMNEDNKEKTEESKDKIRIKETIPRKEKSGRGKAWTREEKRIFKEELKGITDYHERETAIRRIANLTGRTEKAVKVRIAKKRITINKIRKKKDFRFRSEETKGNVIKSLQRRKEIAKELMRTRGLHYFDALKQASFIYMLEKTRGHHNLNEVKNK